MRTIIYKHPVNHLVSLMVTFLIKLTNIFQILAQLMSIQERKISKQKKVLPIKTKILSFKNKYIFWSEISRKALI